MRTAPSAWRDRLSRGSTWGTRAIDMPLLPRLAPFTGVYGLSFVFAMIACAIALAVLAAAATDAVGLARCAGAAAAAAGSARAASRNRTRSRGAAEYRHETEWTPETMATLEQRLVLLSEPANAPLIVWPEVPAPFYPADPSFREIRRRSCARRPDANPVRARGPNAARRAAQLRVPVQAEWRAGARSLRQDQSGSVRRICPGRVRLGEPHHARERRFRARHAHRDAFRWTDHRDRRVHLLRIRLPATWSGSSPRRARMCWSTFRTTATSATARRASSISKLARMRAAENRRWILRATNDGITAMIDPAGRITERLPLYRKQSARVRTTTRNAT